MPADQIQKLLDHPLARSYVVSSAGRKPAEVEGLRQLDPPHRRAGRCSGSRPGPIRWAGWPVSSWGSSGARGKGLEGIELSCEKYLRDKPGQRTVYFDAHRRALFQAPDSYMPPTRRHARRPDDRLGDSGSGRARAVGCGGCTSRRRAGWRIVMNPRTGEVLAMTCYPSFSPATAGKARPELRRNRMLTDPVEPGSIFKPFVMAAALTAGVTRPDETIYCHGGLYVIGKRMLHDSHPYGNLTSTEIVAHSSNIGMAIIGQRLGNRRMHDYLAGLGSASAPGIDLRGEGVGLFMPLKAWNSYTTTSVPMGHELAVTPMQIIMRSVHW